MTHHKPRPDVVELRPVSTADRLERLARRPLQPRREALLMLAARLRALETSDRGEDDQQLSLKDAA